MWSETELPTIHPLTREFVDEFSAYPVFPGDRSLGRESTPRGRSHVNWLKSKLVDGRFFTPVWSTADFGGRRYRVDGGHSSLMLSRADGLFPEGAYVVVRHFQCHDIRDFAELFMEFDPRNSMRNYNEKVQANKAVRPELAHVSPTDTRYALGGIAFFQHGCLGEPQLDEDSRTCLMHAHPEFIVWARGYVRKRDLRRVGVAGAIFGTYQRNPEAAKTFWDQVAAESNPDPNDPTRVLARFLRELAAKTRRNIQWAAAEIYTKCIHAWNAWRSGDRTQLKCRRNGRLPRIRH
jgi:hypothetical protein